MKAVITCAGKGTRLLPFTKELPKEMAPIFSFGKDGIEIKPLIQQIFENLFTIGVREFCFISGKTKRSLQDHFYPDQQQDIPTSLSSFYDMITNSQIAWINQLIPKGFGDAVLASKPFINKNTFIVQAGDVVISSQKHSSITKLIELSFFTTLNTFSVSFFTPLYEWSPSIKIRLNFPIEEKSNVCELCSMCFIFEIFFENILWIEISSFVALILFLIN